MKLALLLLVSVVAHAQAVTRCFTIEYTGVTYCALSDGTGVVAPADGAEYRVTDADHWFGLTQRVQWDDTQRSIDRVAQLGGDVASMQAGLQQSKAAFAKAANRTACEAARLTWSGGACSMP